MFFLKKIAGPFESLVLDGKISGKFWKKAFKEPGACILRKNLQYPEFGILILILLRRNGRICFCDCHWSANYLIILLSVWIFQERIPIEEVFEQLKCTKEGLSSAEGAQRLEIFGPNKLEEKKVQFWSINHCVLRVLLSRPTHHSL